MYFVGPGDNDLFAALAIYCLTMGSVTSYARARAESLGMQAKVGIAERADRLVAILVMTGVADLAQRPRGRGGRARARSRSPSRCSRWPAPSPWCSASSWSGSRLTA